MIAKCNRPTLHDVCTRLRIPIQVEVPLQGLVEELHSFKTVTLPTSKTTTQRADELREVANLAFQLKQAISKLTFEDRWNLEDAYFRRPGDPCHEMVIDEVMLLRLPGIFSVEPHYFALPSKVIPDIENSAKNVCAKIEGAGKAGRSKVIDRYADFIKHIATTLKPTNIAIGRTSAFEDVCCAVFLDAGLTLSGEAMRYFNKNILPKLRAEGRCL